MCFGAIFDSPIPPSHLSGYGQLHYLEHFLGIIYLEIGKWPEVPRAALPPHSVSEVQVETTQSGENRNWDSDREDRGNDLIPFMYIDLHHTNQALQENAYQKLFKHDPCLFFI
jgi:hypothetical protein